MFPETIRNCKLNEKKSDKNLYRLTRDICINILRGSVFFQLSRTIKVSLCYLFYIVRIRRERGGRQATGIEPKILFKTTAINFKKHQVLLGVLVWKTSKER